MRRVRLIVHRSSIFLRPYSVTDRFRGSGQAHREELGPDRENSFDHVTMVSGQGPKDGRSICRLPRANQRVHRQPEHAAVVTAVRRNYLEIDIEK